MNPSRRQDMGYVETMFRCWRRAAQPDYTATCPPTQGKAGREQTAPRSEPSTAAGWRTEAGSGLASGAGGGKGREFLLDPLPSALGALRRLLGTRQNEFFEKVPAVGAGVFKDRHSKAISLLRNDVTAFWLGILPGGPTAHSRKARNSRNAWQDQKPDHQKEDENQEVFHNQNPANRLSNPPPPA